MYLLSVTVVVAASLVGGGAEPVVVAGELGEVYTVEVGAGREWQYRYTYIDREVGGGALRVYSAADDADQDSPVLVVVRHEKGVLSWQLPLAMHDSTSPSEDPVLYTTANRTLCPVDRYSGQLVAASPSHLHTVTIGVSSSSPANISVSVSLYIQPGHSLDMNTSYTVQVSPAAPQFYHFSWPDQVTTAIISLSSPDLACMTLSIQNVSCPVFDLDNTITFSGSYQTVDTRTGMSIRRDLYPLGLHLVLVVKPSDGACSADRQLPLRSPGCSGQHCRIKTVQFNINKKITKEEYLAATFGAFGMFIGAYVIVVLVSCIICVRIRAAPAGQESGTSAREQEEEDYSVEEDGRVEQAGDSVDSIQSLPYDDDSSIDEDDIDMLDDVGYDKEVLRTKPMLFLSDLARKSPRVLEKKSKLYQWNLITIAIFYGLPVVQLVVTYQQVLNQTGNEDLCYYNFLCAHPLGLLSDFNHVFSNLGYVMLGGLFMVLVRRREWHHTQLVSLNPGLATSYGVPQHFGMFYAMGFALIMEGLMSGCYHICPNHSNFQFDTAFMYTIAILCVLKIYQFRHPDINANAYTAFGVLAFVIFVGVLGVVNGSVIFWICFTALYIVSCLLLSLQTYYMGRWRLDGRLPCRAWRSLHHDMRSCCSGAWAALRPQYPDRMILLIIFNIGNWTLAGFGVSKFAVEGGDFASFLLGVLIINLLLYTSFYIVMKLRCGERITRQPATYILLSWATWAGAMYFFLNKSTSWVLSPAASRHLNTDCKLFHFYGGNTEHRYSGLSSFYLSVASGFIFSDNIDVNVSSPDNHDIWHFLSATSLFLSFMILLTLDDDLAEKPRREIPVF